MSNLWKNIVPVAIALRQYCFCYSDGGCSDVWHRAVVWVNWADTLQKQKTKPSGHVRYLCGYLCIGCWNVCFFHPVVVFTVGCRRYLQHYLPHSCNKRQEVDVLYQRHPGLLRNIYICTILLDVSLKQNVFPTHSY